MSEQHTLFSDFFAAHNRISFMRPLQEFFRSYSRTMIFHQMLYWHFEHGGEPFYNSDDELAEQVAATPRQVRYAVDKLIESGYLEKRIGHRPNTEIKTSWYRVNIEAFAADYEKFKGERHPKALVATYSGNPFDTPSDKIVEPSDKSVTPNDKSVTPSDNSVESSLPIDPTIDPITAAKGANSPQATRQVQAMAKRQGFGTPAEKLQLSDNLHSIASGTIPLGEISEQFDRFLHYYANQSHMPSQWAAYWRNWCENYRPMKQSPKRKRQPKFNSGNKKTQARICTDDSILDD